jgi:hypothetical protein
MKAIEIIGHGVVSRRPGARFGYHGWPTVARFKDNTLAIAMSTFRMGHLCPFGKVAMVTSGDEGESWSPPTVLVDSDFDDRDAGLYRLGDGGILLNWFNAHVGDLFEKYGRFLKDEVSEEDYKVCTAYVESVMAGKVRPECGSFVKKSVDGGTTWTDAIRVPITSPHGPTQLADGSILYVGQDFGTSNNGLDGILAYRSVDGGLSWERLSSIPMPKEVADSVVCEPHALQLGDGKILCHIRVHAPFNIYQSVSVDNGRSWSEAVDTGVLGSPPHLMRHSSGAVICSYGRRSEPCGQRVMISFDNGETWERDIVIRACEHTSDIGYTSSVELKDGSILTAYYQALHKGEKASVLYTKWKF